MIFIIKGFWTIVFIFIVISTLDISCLNFCDEAGWFLLLYTHLQHHNDTIIKTDTSMIMTKTQEGRCRKTSLTIFTSHFIARVRKGCSRVACERELEIEHNWNILTPLLWPLSCVLLVLLMLNRRPRTHCWMLAFFIASYQHLLWTPNSIGVSEGSLGRVWLSLPHLVSSCQELYWQLLWLVELNSII